MSTKIFSGYKIHVAPHALLPWLKNFHDTRLKKYIDDYITELSYRYTYIKKAFELFNLKFPKDNYRTLFKKAFDTYIHYSIALIPRETDVLAVFYGSRYAEIEFSKCPDVQYWGYWDSTDRDDRCTITEWHQRENDWRCLSYGVPLIKESIAWEPFTSYDYIELFIPKRGANEINVAHELAARELISNTKITMPLYKLKWKIPYGIVKYMFYNKAIRVALL